MIVEGEAADLSHELFPHGLVPQILQLIVDTWRSFRRPKDEEDEPKITNRFVVELQAEARWRKARFLVMAHVKDLEDLDPITGKSFVEIDICVLQGYEPRCYFGIEAKKLNTTTSGGKWESHAGKYSGNGGMGCFVDGRYAHYQCQGAMVGYVIDGDCTRAKECIKKSIEKRAKALRVPVPCPLHPAEHLPDNSDAFETLHSLDRGEFKIYHVLLAA
ncbi:MAG: hypothetical protein IH987_11980 [Planctomycetes bacterium]|nr:hypothetical protein [Planctomycetota bacterium]